MNDITPNQHLIGQISDCVDLQNVLAHYTKILNSMQTKEFPGSVTERKGINAGKVHFSDCIYVR